jgi:PAS domain S-box-containing protein
MVNTEMERLFGYRRDELIGRPVTMLVPDGLHVSTGGNAASSPPAVTPERHRIGMRSDGTKFPVEVRQNPLHIRDRLLVLGTVVDITDRLRNDRLKDEFVSTVSHELRTPLTSIAGSLGLLTGGAAGSLPDPIMRLLKIAHKNSERLVRLINDILDIEKIESGKVVFDLKRVEVRGLVEQAIEANRGFADSFAVRVTLDGNAVAAYVRADADRLVQVLTNLLSNAAKFSPPNSEVIVGIECHAETVHITVRDRGPGIPEDFKPRIFEKFAQADATDARQKGGTGLGLSIVKQIVAFLGGSVGFEDAPGGGTIFFVDLPRWELSGDTTASDDPVRGRILVCDDDASVAQTIAARLEREGFTPDVAATAADARIKASARSYDSILMDLKLPDGDGISLIQELRAQERHENTPIVVISAEAERGRDDFRSASLDVLDWLNKPIDIHNLVGVLNRPLARNGGGRQHVLHIDDDASVLGFVSEALTPHCDVVSVSSLARAREALTATQFSLVVLDLMLSQDSGLDILPELRGHDGTALPVILYSARASNGTYSAQVQAALNKSPQSIDHLVLTLRKHMAGHDVPVTRKEVA